MCILKSLKDIFKRDGLVKRNSFSIVIYTDLKNILIEIDLNLKNDLQFS